MRLLNVNTLKFTEFKDQFPPYAILSHRWYDREPSREDFYDRSNTSTPGCQKALLCCRLVKQWDAQIEWLWVDTVCVDKNSSAELSEVIQSMMKWYREARICFAYLHDVRPSSAGRTKVLDDFQHSVWFSRGWTLQELLAPKTVIFLTSNWELIGHKGPFMGWPASSENLNDYIAATTGLPSDVLRNYANAEKYSIEDRLQWARSRTTTRPEDRVYSVLGLLNIAMPVLYGEGVENAIDRLEDALSRRQDRRRIPSSTSQSDGRPANFVRTNEHPRQSCPRPVSSMSLPILNAPQDGEDSDPRRHTTSGSTDRSRYARDWTDIVDNLSGILRAPSLYGPINHTPRFQSPASSGNVRSGEDTLGPKTIDSGHGGTWKHKPLPRVPINETSSVSCAITDDQSPSIDRDIGPIVPAGIHMERKLQTVPEPSLRRITNEPEVSSALSVSPTVGRLLQPFKGLRKSPCPVQHPSPPDSPTSRMISDLQHSLAQAVLEIEQQRVAREHAERQLEKERALRDSRETRLASDIA